MPQNEATRGAELGVSIVTFRVDPGAFARVLDSLAAAVDRFVSGGHGAVDVKILDNGGQEGVLRELVEARRNQAWEIRLIAGLPNIGYGRAHNLAILTSTATYHLILNPDVLMDEDCLVRGVNYLRAHPGVKAVAPQAVDGQGRLQYLCKNFPTLLDLALRGFAPRPLQKLFDERLMRYEMRHLGGLEPVTGIPLLSGCYMLCETAALKRAGGFDERFFLYFEDFALSLELAKQGELAYLPAMKITHFGGNSARKGLRHIGLFASSAIKFFNLYGWKFI